MEFSRHEYWSGFPFPFPGDLPDPGIKPGSPALHAYSLLLSQQGSPDKWFKSNQNMTSDSWSSKESISQTETLRKINELIKTYIPEPYNIDNIYLKVM